MNLKTTKTTLSFFSLFLLSFLLTTKVTTAQAPASGNNLIPAGAKEVTDVSPDIKSLLKYYDKQVYFTENKGQWDNKVLYKADFPLGKAIVTKNGVLMSSYDHKDMDAEYKWGINQEEAQKNHTPFTEPAVKIKSHNWMMKFVNNSPEMTIDAKEKHKDVFNYFKGNVAATNVANYQEVWYNNVYDKVDVRYYPSAEGSLEYDIVCKPGFDKKNIAIQLEGINKMHITADGGLVLKTSVGDMSFPVPVAYQKINGKQVAVKAKYRIDGNNILKFDLGSFDASQPLIIDPIALRWATWVDLNSSGEDHCHGVWIDPNDGSIYVVSRTDTSASLITTGAYETTPKGGINLVVGKYTEPASVGGSGSRIWQTYIGGSDDDNPYALEEGPDGNIYITGYTDSKDFPLIGGSAFSGSSIDDRSSTNDKIFILKITEDGQSIKSSVIGGNGADNSFDLRIDPTSGNIAICGNTNSTNLATVFSGSGASNNLSNGIDVIVFKINQDLSSIVWMKNYGGTGTDEANIMLQNPGNGDIFVAGYTESTDFPTTKPRQSTLQGTDDGFIQKLNSSGTIEWSSYFNSTTNVVGSKGKGSISYVTHILCMEFNTTYNELYFGGITTGLYSTNVSSSGVIRTAYNGGDHDFFVTSMDTNQTLVKSTYLGGTSDEINMMGLNVDLNNDVYIFGYSNSTSTSSPSSTAFPVTSDALQSNNLGSYDKVFCKLSTTLDTLLYSTFYGGSGDDYDPVGERGIKFSNCRIYTVVTSESLDLPLTQGAINTNRSASDVTYEPGLVVWANPPDLLNNTIVGKQTVVCAGTIPDSIKGSAASYTLPSISRNNVVTGYPNVIPSTTTYQWETSTDSINWSLPISGATGQNLPGGVGGKIPVITQKTYFRRLINGDACVYAGPANQIVTVQIVSVTATINNVSCYGFGNGSLIANALGQSPFKYKWSTGATTQTISNLSPASYSITITDNTSCSATNTFAVTQPNAALSATPTTPTQATCGNLNGTAGVTASGGTTPYTYYWSNTTQTTASLTGLGANTYNVTVTDKNGCTATASTSVTQASTLTTVLTPTSPLCHGGTNGSVSQLPSGGTTPYKYVWNNNATTQNISNLSAGNYSVTVTDKNNCTATQSTAVINPADLVPATTQTNLSCNGVNNGSINLTVTGGTTAYTYKWSSGQTTQNISGLSAITYTVTVTDAHGCDTTKVVTITQPANPLSIGGTPTPASCNGYSDGSVSTSPSGGTSPYTYNWSNTSQTTGNITGLAFGTYNVTITDAHGCTATNGFSVGQPNTLSIEGTPSPASCNGYSNGSVNTTPAGGTSPYSYNWSNTSQTTGNITGLAFGTYNVTITDAHGCTATNGFSVGQPNTLSINGTPTPASCNGFSNGSVNTTPAGGTSPYTYNWSNTSQTTGNITGLAFGTYNVTITDAHGCTATNGFSVGQPNPLSINGTPTPASCNGFSNGSVNTTPSGGTSPYTYNWSNTSQTTGNITGLAFGTYNVTITDAHGCTATNGFSVGQPNTLSVNGTPTPASCNGYSDGSVNTTPSGGTSPYTYNWSNTSQTTGNITGLAFGTYNVTITDAHGCTATNGFSVGQPNPLSINGTPTPASCNGYSDGSVNTTPSGGTSPYTYNWSNTSQTTGNITGLAFGTYNVTITDAHGCTATNGFSVGQPNPLSINGTPTPASCNGYSDGSVNTTPAGGTSPYTYNWSNTSQTTGNITGLAFGTYNVTITDAHGCTATNGFSVGQPNTLSINGTPTPASCNGYSDGSVNTTPAGGTSPYTYNWSNTSQTTGNITGLAFGTYNVTITDAHGCTATNGFSVGQPNPLSINGTPTPASCNGYSDGSVNTTPAGGTSPYTYNWSNTSQTTGNITGLAFGTYNVTITDAHGCTATNGFSVGQPNPLSINGTPTPASCNGYSDGSVNTTPAGGTSPYTYNWSNTSQTTGNITGLAFGTYNVTITDSHGCTATNGFSVGQPDVLSPSGVPTDASCGGFKNGSIDLSVTGGTSPYTYKWDDNSGATTQDLTGLGAGTYNVTVTDSHGCTATDQSKVGEPGNITLGGTSMDATCNGFSDGTVTLTVDGGTSPYTYSWTGVSSTTQDLTGLAFGTYTVTVTDSHNCQAIKGFSVGQPNPLSINGTPTPASCNGFSDGSVNTTPAGGTTPYTYNWSNTSQTTGNITGLAFGTYNVTITDAHGCTATNGFSVGQPNPLSINGTPSPASCNGYSDGSVNTTPSGGTSPYTYNWSNTSQTTGNITGLAFGTYNVTITDAHGCTATNGFSVGQPNPLSINGTPTPASCNGYSDGSVNTTPSGGTSPYTYNWSNTSQTTGNITGLAFGTYNVTITDAHGCTATNGFSVGQPNPLSINGTPTPASCNGYSDGSVNTTPAGGTSPYTYNWSNTSQTTGNITGLAFGTYNVTITDAHGCTATNGFSVGQPNTLSINGTPTPASCNGYSDGSVNTTPAGGTSPYTYNWSNTSQTTGNITGLAFGTYNVTITDAHGCTATNGFSVGQPNTLSINGTPTPASCNGYSDGSVNTTPAGGTSPYTYNWSNTSQTTGNITGLAFGTYNVTITDAHGCTATNGFSVGQPNPLSINGTPTPASCNGYSDGSVNTTPAGGTSPYTYNWSNTSQTTGNITGLAFGTYNVTITDSHGCTATNGFSVGQPDVLSPSGVPTDASCGGFKNGSIDLSVTGGTSPYTYKWDDNSGATTQDLTGLGAGTYNVTVTDSHGCTATDQSKVGEPGNITLGGTSMDATCNGFSDGTVTLTVDGGTSPYTYSWTGVSSTTQDLTGLAFGTYTVTVTDSHNCQAIKGFSVGQPNPLSINGTPTPASCNGFSDGSVNTTPAGGTTPYTYNWSNTSQTTGNITGLAFGTYNVTITDAHGCTATNGFSVGQPNPLSINGTPTPASCNGYSDGSVNTTPSGGTSPYTYNWSNTSQTTGNITGLAFGTYNVTITDAHGCTATNGFSVGQPNPLSINGTPTPASCNGYSDGSVSTTPSGGTSPYTYNWSNTSQTTGNITGLAFGTYNVTITDAHGCTATNGFSVGQPNPLSINGTPTPASCNGYSDGSVNTTPSGGTSPYTYNWSNTSQTTGNITGLAFGTYNVTITDAHGCTATNGFSVGQPNPLSINGTPTPASCNGYSDGSVNTTPAGGTSPYTYNWSNTSQTTGNITGLAFGTYNVTITDAHGCTATNGFSVGQPNPIIPSISHVNTNTCQGGNCNGSITLGIVSGGISPFTYNWSNGETTQNISGLCQARYYVTITDSHGCQAFANDTVDCCATSITITKKLAPPLALPPATDWQFTSNIPGYSTFTVSAAGGSTTLTGMPFGTYTITETLSKDWKPSNTSALDSNIAVINVNACGNYPVTFTNTQRNPTPCNTPFSVTLDSTNVTCNGAANGGISLTLNGGSSPFTYNWSNNATTQNLSGLSGATYCVTVTYVQGCSGLATGCIKVNEPNVLKIVCSTQPNICYGADNGVVNITVTGGTMPYKYKWSNGSTTQDITGLIAGPYSVTVTDNNGCSTTGTFNVYQNPAITLTLTPTNCTSSGNCSSGCNGKVVASVTGGVSPYTYKWSTGATTSTISNLCGATYSVTVTDKAGCIKICSAAIVCIPQCNISLTTAYTNCTTSGNCSTGCNGTVSVTAVNNAVSPYKYKWSTGATTSSISKLCGATYTVTVTDAVGCSKTASICIVCIPQCNISLTTAFTNCTSSSNCSSGCNGTASVTAVNNAVSPYKYKWSTGATTSSISKLCGATYTVTVTDAVGCSKTASICIVCIPQCNISLTTAYTNCTSSSNCNSGCNGTASVTAVNNAVSPYKYKWSTGATTSSISKLCGATYTVTVTDAVGCSKTASICIVCIPQCNISLTTAYTNCTTSGNCSTGCNGTVSVTAVNNAVSPYKYKWSTGATTSSISKLCGATYTVTVTDAVGCSKTASICIVCIPQCNISLTTAYTNCTSSYNCNSGCNGTASVTAVNNAVSPYKYKWSTGATTSSISKLCGATYTVTVTDAVGCSKTASVCIVCIPQCNISLTTAYTNCTSSSNCSSGCNGTASVTAVNNAVSPYKYKWSTGATTSSISKLCGATYTVTVTDAVGCSKTASICIVCIPQCNISLTTAYTNCTTSNTCSSGCNGTASVTAVNNAVSPYKYKWSTGATTSSISKLCGATYTVTVTDAVGCSKTASICIVCIPQCNISLTTAYTNCTSSRNCTSGCNGTASVTAVNNAVSPYKYKWSTGATTSSINKLCGGTYKVTVTDNAGCTKTASISIVCGNAYSRMDESQTADSNSVTNMVMETYPNPFSSDATVDFVSPENMTGTLQVVNVIGQVMDVIFEGNIEAGIKYTFTIDGSDLPSGTYFCRLVTDKGVYTKRIVKIVR